MEFPPGSYGCQRYAGRASRTLAMAREYWELSPRLKRQIADAITTSLAMVGLVACNIEIVSRAPLRDLDNDFVWRLTVRLRLVEVRHTAPEIEAVMTTGYLVNHMSFHDEVVSEQKIIEGTCRYVMLSLLAYIQELFQRKNGKI